MAQATTDPGARAPGRLTIKVVADFVCPWCYLGFNRMKRALARRPALRYRFIFQPFLLNPDTPSGGIPLRHYMSATAAGDPKRLLSGVIQAAALDGLPLDLSRIMVMPDSTDAHRLVRWAGRIGDPAGNLQSGLAGALYEAYFGTGLDIGRQSVLIRLAAGAGLDAAAAADFLASNEDREAVRRDHHQARGMGIKGVPCFIIDGKYAISGAEDPEVFLPLLDLARVGEMA